MVQKRTGFCGPLMREHPDEMRSETGRLIADVAHGG